jgi:hypothetical protein
MRTLLSIFLLTCISIFANAQSGFNVETNVINVVDNQLQVVEARFETVGFTFNLNKKTLDYTSPNGSWQEEILNYTTGVNITPVLLDDKDYGFELANAIHEVWTNAAYYQLYASVGAPSQVYVIVEHPFVGNVLRRVYFKIKQ